MADELRKFAADLGRTSYAATVAAQRAIAKGAGNIKKQLQSEAKSKHFSIARHISYDLAASGMSAVIGPEKVGAGNLANIAYFGGANGGGGSLPDPMGALAAEAPKLEKAIIDACVGVFLNREVSL